MKYNTRPKKSIFPLILQQIYWDEGGEEGARSKEEVFEFDHGIFMNDNLLVKGQSLIRQRVETADKKP